MSELQQAQEINETTLDEAAARLKESRYGNEEPVAEEPVPEAAPENEPEEEVQAEAEENLENTEETAESDENVENSDDEETVIIKIDGEEKEVPLTALLETYQKSESADQKFQQASEIRKQSQKRINEADQILQQYTTELEAIRQELGRSQLSDAQLADLKEKDPNAYIQYRDALDQNMAVARQAEQKQTEIINLVKQRETQALLNAVPDWEDAAKFNEDREHIKKFAGNYGFAPEEIESIMDHRIVLLLRDAAKGALAEKETSITLAKKGGAGSPKALPRGKGGPRLNTTSQKKAQAHINNLQAQLNKDPSDLNVAAALLKAKRELKN